MAQIAGVEPPRFREYGFRCKISSGENVVNAYLGSFLYNAARKA
jgi:hypothetical protein